MDERLKEAHGQAAARKASAARNARNEEAARNTRSAEHSAAIQAWISSHLMTQLPIAIEHGQTEYDVLLNEHALSAASLVDELNKVDGLHAEATKNDRGAPVVRVTWETP